MLVPWPGIGSTSPALEGGFLTTGPPGKFPQIKVLKSSESGHEPAMNWTKTESPGGNWAACCGWWPPCVVLGGEGAFPTLRKGTTEDEMVGWHHWLGGHEFERAPGVGEGQGSLACCSPCGCKESDMTERLNWTEGSNMLGSQCTPSLPSVGRGPGLPSFTSSLWDEELEPSVCVLLNKNHNTK